MKQNKKKTQQTVKPNNRIVNRKFWSIFDNQWNHGHSVKNNIMEIIISDSQIIIHFKIKSLVIFFL